MPHDVTRPQAPFTAAGGRLRIHQVPAAQDNLIWLVECLESGEVAAVDGPSAHEVQDYCAVHGLTLTTILNTHTHPDHIGINRALAKQGVLKELRVVGFRGRADEIPGLSQGVDEGDRVRVGDVEGRVFRTEGHIDGHISFLFEDVLFCGDTLFTGGCGYLFDGPPESMYQSLMRLSALPGHVRVCCAHEYTQDNLRFAWSVEPGNAALAERIRQTWRVRADGGCVVPSTIALERATNPFLRPDSEELRRSVADAWPARSLATPAQVFAATRALKDRKDYRSNLPAPLPL
jgi:hydroxyacylglutathione hydrolase